MTLQPFAAFYFLLSATEREHPLLRLGEKPGSGALLSVKPGSEFIPE